MSKSPKSLWVTLFVLLSLALSACDATSSPPQTPTPTQAAASASATPQANQVEPLSANVRHIGWTNSLASASPSPSVKTSAGKIRAALSSGSIDEDTALVNLFLAAYDPDSLPAEFKGDVPDEPTEATATLMALQQRLDKLSPELRTRVEPYFTRPNDPDSFWYSSLTDPEDNAPPGAKATATATTTPNFQYVDAAQTKIRVWYDANIGAKAQTLAQNTAAEIDRSGMWDLEKQAMLGHEPCSDAKISDNGGDGHLDVYLVPKNSIAPRPSYSGEQYEFAYAGLTIPQAWDRKCGLVAFLLVNRSQVFDQLKDTVAHELFHAFQMSFTMSANTNAEWDAYSWWMESTATWSEDLVYPDLNAEWVWLGPGGWASKDGPLGPLDAFEYASYPQYASYIWPFYLTHHPASEGSTLIGKTWRDSADQLPIETMYAMPDWPDRFKEFALWLWNRPDVDKLLDDGKPITPLKQNAASIELNVNADDGIADVDLGRTSIAYYQVDINDAPGVVHQLSFDLSSIADVEGAGVQAIVAIGNPDQPTLIYDEDWSARGERTFCRDNDREAASRVIIVVTNSQGSDDQRLTGQIVMRASTKPCSTKATPQGPRPSTTP